MSEELEGWRATRGGIAVFVRDGLAASPGLIRFVCDRAVGAEYGVGRLAKARLLLQFVRNAFAVDTLTSLAENVELAAAILRLPRSAHGDVVECGCFKGGSTVNLSLVCALVGRRLVVFDSFQGLPDPKDYDQAHAASHTAHIDIYFRGRFAAGRDEVELNLRSYGRGDVCDLVPGFFADTLPGRDGAVALAFLDVDLIDSLKECLRGIWPRLDAGGRLYVHEARNLAFVAVFFDAGWWDEALGCAAPGLVGAGAGLPLSISGSNLGYTQRGSEAAALSPITGPIEHLRRLAWSKLNRLE